MKSRISRVTLSLFTGLALGALASRAQAADFVLADFEAGGPTNNLFGYWFYYGDATNEGNSKISTCDSITGAFDTSSVVSPGYNQSLMAARLSFVYGDKMPTCGTGCTYDQEVAIGTDLRIAPDTVMNLTGATAITFQAKALKPMKLNFVVNLASVTDYSHYRQVIDVGTNWNLYTVVLKSSAAFAQPNWGKPVPWNAAEVQTINWVATKALNKTLDGNTLFIDDVTIQGWDPSAVRFERRVARNGLRMASGPSGLTLTLPEAYRNSAGMLRIDDLMGRVVATARYAKGQETVIVTPASMRRSQGPFFARSLAK